MMVINGEEDLVDLSSVASGLLVAHWWEELHSQSPIS